MVLERCLNTTINNFVSRDTLIKIFKNIHMIGLVQLHKETGELMVICRTWGLFLGQAGFHNSTMDVVKGGSPIDEHLKYK